MLQSRRSRVVSPRIQLDDSNSLVRYLPLRHRLRTEGLIYASSGFHWKGDGTGKWSVPGLEYFRFGLDLCRARVWRWALTRAVHRRRGGDLRGGLPNLRVHDEQRPPSSSRRSGGKREFDGDISKDARFRPDQDAAAGRRAGPHLSARVGWAEHDRSALESIQERYEGTPEWPAITAEGFAQGDPLRPRSG